MLRQHGPTGCFAMALALCLSATAFGEILYLKEGGSVEGEVQEINENGYRVRTVYGVIVVPFESVIRREESVAIVTQYDQKLRTLEDTAAAQFELAAWCDANGMKAEFRRHAQRAIELDPEYEPARTALGFVRVNGLWIDGRAAADKSASKPADGVKPRKPSRPEESDEEAMISAIQAQYTGRIRAIRSTYLDSSAPDLVAEGKKRIQEFDDPLAILPLCRVLSNGSEASRQSLVDLLARFPQDEATLNLAAIALMDRSGEIRHAALGHLTKRDDPRIASQFRKALGSDNDMLIRRASIGLGLFKTVGAVPELIDVLTAQRRKRIEMPVNRYISGWQHVFNQPTSLQIGRSVNVKHLPQVGIATAGSFPLPDTEMRVQDVTVFRTEVLEALVAITGVNHGFDAAAWRRWYQEKKP